MTPTTLRRGMLVLGLTLATLMVLTAAPAVAQVSSVNGQIAYSVCEYSTVVGMNVCDIWVMNADGTGQTNVTNTPTDNEFGPVWSPDGTRIAFVEGYNGVNRLLVIQRDGSGKVVVTPDPSYQFSPTWSPGGTQIALVRQVPGEVITIQFDIVVVNVDGSGEVNITNTDADELDPAWSPDGGRIAFAAVRPETYLDPIDGTPITGAQWEIVTVNPDGSDELVLTTGDPGTPRATHLEEDRGPSWSPDGAMLTFMSQSVDPCCSSWQVWAVNRDGSGVTNLTSDESVNDMFPSWSPDGTQIVFSRYDGQGGFDLYAMPAPSSLPLAGALSAAAGSAVRLTTTGNASDPDWGRNPDAPRPPFAHTLYVSLAQPGRMSAGTVTSTTPGIRCGRDCSETYAPGVQVTLQAAARRGFAFAGWTGACSGLATTCTVTMDDVKIVQATFIRK